MSAESVATGDCIEGMGGRETPYPGRRFGTRRRYTLGLTASEENHASGTFLTRLRRDLGSIESYAAMIGILVGAGIFRVTSVASEATGAGVILGYLVLTPVVLATSVSYAVFLSTSLGREPGGEYAYLSAVLGGRRVAFSCAWLKTISYIGGLAYLAGALADYGMELLGLEGEALRGVLALLGLGFFYFVHISGVRWFGRLQVGMCAVLGISILVLVLPGLFAVEKANYTPWFPHGTSGFLSALPPLFFAFAAFESLAHTAGEVKNSSQRLPGIFLWGITATALIFVAMTVVAFGVLPADELSASVAPMADVAKQYLPAGAAILVTLGGVLAVATSVNATMLVPARMWIVLARDGHLPRWLGYVHTERGTPGLGLTVTFALAALLLLSGQLLLALNMAVFGLILVYLLNSWALLLLPRRNPELYRQATVAIPPFVQRAAAVTSILGMGALICVQVVQDLSLIGDSTVLERFENQSTTSIELLALWSVIGAAIFFGMRSSRGEGT